MGQVLGTVSPAAFVDGSVSPGYESVRSMFQENIIRGKERNAQLCVYVDGECVVDLWGSADGDKSYTGDSLQSVFSSSKAVTAVAVAQLVDRGFLNYNNPIANYWPEFADQMKGSITVAEMLKHEGGMPHLHNPVSYEDLLPGNLANGKVAEILAKQTPIYPVHTPREYHNQTAGWVLNEVFRRQSPDKESMGSWVQREIAAPLGADVYLGLPDTLLTKVADLSGMSQSEAMIQSLLPKFFGSKVDHNIIVFSKLLQSFNKRFRDPDPRGYAPDVPVDSSDTDAFLRFVNSWCWRHTESPHGNVHASARGLARVAAAMADQGALGDVRILSREGWSLLHDNSTVEVDAAMGKCRTQFTQGGVNMFVDYDDDVLSERVFKSGRHGFIGWLGFGGSVLQWHPSARIGFGYTCTLVTWWDLVNTNARKLQKEVVKCAEKKKSIRDVNNNDE